MSVRPPSRAKGTNTQWMKDYLQGREMRTAIKGSSSSWCEVTTGVLQGSVLAPVLFKACISDVTGGLNSFINLFADDAKQMKIKSQGDCDELQRDTDKTHDRSPAMETGI